MVFVNYTFSRLIAIHHGKTRRPKNRSSIFGIANVPLNTLHARTHARTLTLTYKFYGADSKCLRCSPWLRDGIFGCAKNYGMQTVRNDRFYWIFNYRHIIWMGSSYWLRQTQKKGRGVRDGGHGGGGQRETVHNKIKCWAFVGAFRPGDAHTEPVLSNDMGLHSTA